LTVFKFVAGILGHSLAMISDAIHSASDVFSTVIVIIGIKISAKAADKDHEFGHERYECVAAILLAVLLFATGCGIGYSGITKIVDGSYKTALRPDYLAMSAAIVSIVVKECMFWYTWVAAKKTNSGALKADAWHHRSDALSSVGSLIGIVGAMCGVPVLDCVAAIVICLLILKAAIDIFIDAVNKMTDKACDAETENAINRFVASCEGVKSVDSLMTRLFGNRIYVVLEIACDQNLILKDAHDIAEAVHEGVEKNFPLVKHVTVHVNPYTETKEESIEQMEEESKEETAG
ncbi:MAG: cation diffusion facilitator family transporter, partial [Clostridia bacterium]|nr:cation diffusion facilitator family transporter [Clostridia bacterium]